MSTDQIEGIVSEAETERNIASYLNFFFENSKTLIWVTFVSALFSIIYALVQDKYYSASVTMIEADESNSGLSAFSNITEGFGGFSSIIGGLSGSVEGSKTSKALAILGSRTFVEEFIEENNLLTIILSDDWNIESQSWIDGEKDLFDAYMEFRNQIILEKDNKTNTYSLTVEWKDPKLSAIWANLLFKKINEKMSQEDREAAERNIQYLQSQLNKNEKVSIQNTLHSMIEQQSKIKMLANSQKEYAFEAIDLAIPPKERSKPQRRLIVLVGTMIGFILSMGYIFIKEYLLYIRKIYNSDYK